MAFISIDENGNLIHHANDNSQSVVASNTLSASGDITGTTDYTRITTALSSSNEVSLAKGTYYLSQSISIASGKTLYLNSSIIKRGTSWVNTSTDDRTGSVFRIRGAASGTVNTTLSANVKLGASSITVASATGISTSSWLKITAIVEPLGPDIITVTAGELVLVSSAYAGGTTVALDEPKAIPAKSAGTVTSITPNIGARIIGPGTLDWTGGIAAVGIEVTNAYDVILDNISFRGFTRTAIDHQHSKLVYSPRITILGDCNGGIFTDSCQFHNVGVFETTGRYGRRHTSGIPRYMLWDYNHSVQVVINAAYFHKVCGGHRQWGGVGCGVENWTANDLDNTDIILNSLPEESSNVPASAPVGVVHDGGAGPINNYTAFGRACFFGSGTATNIRHPDPTVQATIYVHDHTDFRGGDWTIVNQGSDPDLTGNYITGIAVKDSTGQLGRIICRGMARGASFYGVPLVNIAKLYINGSAGDGTLGAVALYLDHAGGNGTSPQIDVLHIDNITTPIVIGPDFHSNPDRQVFAARFRNGGGSEFSDVGVVTTLSTSVNSGGVCRFRDTSPDVEPETTGISKRQAVFCGPRADFTNPYPGYSYALVAYGLASIATTGTAAKFGELLVSNNASQVVVNNTPSSGSSVWRAIRPTSGGFTQAQYIGVIP